MANVEHSVSLSKPSLKRFRPYYFLENSSQHIATAFLSIFLYIAFSDGYVEKLFSILQNSPFKASLFGATVLFALAMNVYFFRKYSKQEEMRQDVYDELTSSVKSHEIR